MRVSPFDNLLVYEQDYSVAEIDRLISANNLDGLQIKSLLKDEFLKDISFIEGLSSLKKLSIVSNFQYDLSAVSKLSSLEWLNINCKGFSYGNLFQNLNIKTLILSMRREKFTLFLPDTIESLYVDEVDATNLGFIKGARHMRRLEIKSSKLSSLIGLEEFHYLYELKLSGIPGLKEIGLEMPSSIKTISLNQLKNLSTINVAHLEGGVEVNITSCPKLNK